MLSEFNVRGTLKAGTKKIRAMVFKGCEPHNLPINK